MEEAKELQTVNVDKAAIVQNFANTEALEKSIKSAEMYAEYLDRIRKIALRLTNCDDWVDQNGKPYLQGTGCSKIAGGFGMRVIDVERQREEVTDDRGQYVMYSYSGTGEWNNNSTHETGVASSRDDFFALRKDPNNPNGDKILLPLCEVDLTDVQKKAHTNLMNRLIKRLLGLSFSWEEIEKETEGRISKEKCNAVKYDKGKKGGNADTDPKTADKRAQLRKMILDIACGDEQSAKEYLKCKTAFKIKEGKDAGKEIPGKTNVDNLSENQVKYLFPVVEKEHKDHLDALAKEEKAGAK